MDSRDECAIMTMDVRLPTTPCTAMEKLKGWLILMDCVIGATHPVAIATHNFTMRASAPILEFSSNVKQ